MFNKIITITILIIALIYVTTGLITSVINMPNTKYIIYNYPKELSLPSKIYTDSVSIDNQSHIVTIEKYWEPTFNIFQVYKYCNGTLKYTDPYNKTTIIDNESIEAIIIQQDCR